VTGFALQPRRVTAMQVLDALTEDQFETLLEDYASGTVTWEGMATPLGVTAIRLQQWIRSREDVRAAFKEAEQYRAERLADSTLELADKAPPFGEDIAKAALQVKARQWMAEKLDPTRFGKLAKQTINIGSLHLTAVREINAEETQRRMAAMQQKREDFETREALPAEIVPDSEPVTEGDDVGDTL
jgi:hypothetical protein